MIHTKRGFGCVRASLTAVAALALVACGGGGGGSKGGASSGGGSTPTDTTAPDTTIAAKPDAVTKATTASFTFSASESGSSFEVSVDGGAFVATPANLNLTSVAEGEHTLSVRAIDAAKNVDASPATATWRVDLTAPSAQVLFPPAHSYTDANQVTLRGKISEPNGSTLKVNGADVTVAADGTWSSVVQVAAGENTFAVSTADAVGNNDAAAAIVHVTNSGPAISYVRGMDVDSAHNRLLLADYERRQILAVDLSTGRTSVFAGYDASSPAPLLGVSNLVVDAPKHRVIAVDLLGNQLVEIDLETRARRVLSNEGPGYSGVTSLVGTSGDYTGIALDSQSDVAYVTRGRDSVFSVDPGVLKIDLLSGARSILSGMAIPSGGPLSPAAAVGSGPDLTQPTDIVFDASTTPARLLVSHSGNGVMEVDPTSGNRTTFFAANNTQGSIARMKLDGQGKLLVASFGGSVPVGVFAIDLNTATSDQAVDTMAVDGLYSGVYSLAWDSVHQRVYLASLPTFGIYSAALNGDLPSPLAHSDVGTGPKTFSIAGVVKSGNVLYFADAWQDALLRLDLATGNRIVVSSNAVGTGPAFGNLGTFAIDEVGNRALASGFEGPNSDALLAVDLATGNRTVVSDNAVGGGPLLDQPTFVAWDASASRALVVDRGTYGDSALLSIDQQGNRVLVSNLDTGSMNTAVPGGLVLDHTAGHAIVSLGRVLEAGTSYDVDLGTGDITPYSSVASLGLWMHPTERAILTVDGQKLSLFDFNNAPRVVSGRSNGSSIGSGIEMIYPNSVAADPSANVAYVTDSYSYGIFAVDLTTGERVLISR